MFKILDTRCEVSKIQSALKAIDGCEIRRRVTVDYGKQDWSEVDCNRIEIESSKTDIHLGCRLKGEGSNFFVVLQGFDSEDFFQRLLLFLVMVVADRFRRCTGSTKIVVYIVVVVVVVAVQHTIIREL